MRYSMMILRSVFLQEAPFALLINQMWPLALIGLVTLTLAACLFRQRMY